MRFFLTTLGAFLVAVFMVGWTALTVTLYGVHGEYWWDSRCLPGNPSLANGQAAIAVAGMAIGFYAIVRQRPRAFAVSVACLLVWLGCFAAWAALPDRDRSGSCPHEAA